MTATLDVAHWLTFIQQEYLDSFIRDGGSSVKFVVPLDEALRPGIENGIAERSREAGYIVATVSSATTRVHMMDQVFFRVAEQVPWRRLSEDVLVKLALDAGYQAPTAGSEGAMVARLAAANNLDPAMVHMEARTWIGNQILLEHDAVLRRQSLAKDFRVAVTQLCLAELLGGPDGETSIEVITDWLTGRNTAVSAVKPYQIFTRITRSNARHLLESLLLWVRYAGYAGVVIVLDIARVTIAQNPHDDLLFYSKAAMFDTYEVLRQCIDATDRMKGCLLAVVPAPEFLDVEPYGRGMGAYDALKFRVYDEVRDQRLVNPLGALVRISAQGGVV